MKALKNVMNVTIIVGS